MEENKRNHIEIMAPAGSFESLMAAIQAGTDSVYFGVEQLNMRARSSVNFTLDDLKEIVRIARENQIKTYLTLNTVIFNEEIGKIAEIIEIARREGISAIIASDQAVIAEARKHKIKTHLSTQLNISNIESLRFYSAFADVVVLARELNLEQIRAIAEQIDRENILGPSGEKIRIELFVHGALCMAVSGKCYMSLHQYDYSANRGSCLQACRRTYILTEKETGKELEVDNEYIMSPKDLCTISFLDKILKAGVRVLKIEGRARPPEYVKTVTRCYREAVDAIIAGEYNRSKIDSWTAELSTVFNRGFWDGYYLGQELGEWSKSYGSAATMQKIYVGKGTNYFNKIKVAEFLIEAKILKTGDEIIISGPTTGVIQTKVSEIRLDDKQVPKAEKGDIISIPIDQVVRRSDKLFKLVSRSEKS